MLYNSQFHTNNFNWQVGSLERGLLFLNSILPTRWHEKS